MNGAALIALLPEIVLGAAAVLLLLVIAVRRDPGVCASLTAVALILAFGALFVAATRAPLAATPLMRIDGYALFFTGIVLLTALAVTLLSYVYWRGRRGCQPEEYYVLLLLATLGAVVLVASDQFASFFVGLETLSISLLGLIAYPRAAPRPIEASLKYLLLSGVASALLLFGIALLYDRLGTLSFSGLPLAAPVTPSDVPMMAGVALIIAGLGFKLSVVPFHLWAPDIYEGAPAPVSAFIAVVSKCAVLALLLRYFVTAAAFNAESLLRLLTAIAVLSILVGNLLALLQDNLKRLLAYSSIAHLGYALVAFIAGGALAIEAVSAYLVAYALTTVGAFGVISLCSQPQLERDADRISDYQSLFWTRPALAVTLTVMLLSLAGIPLTLGFIAKFYAVTAGVAAHLTAAVTALIIGSILGLYYYLRVIAVLIRAPSAPDVPAALPPARAGALAPGSQAVPSTPLGSALLLVLLVLLVGLGVYPAPLLSLIRHTAVPLAVGSALPTASVQSAARQPLNP